ncbi:YodC family protein [Candidatus Electronema sp. PJ]|uniref:YodC family protein n=1 Tax=Candidatus Electronema sp. PJ TaxID=3401572 RepID=UPI003AA7F8C8
MASEKIEVGQIVRLKSGGPKMTVGIITHSNGMCICQWFTEGKLEKGDLPLESLESVEPDEIKATIGG